MVKLLEVEGKALFREAGISVPKGILISLSRDIKNIVAPCAVKAQVLHGKRGKEGLIKVFEETDDARKFAQQLLRHEGVFSVLVEEKVDILHEYYLSLMVDEQSRDVICIFSKRGGMDIEEVARKYPRAVVRFPVVKAPAVVRPTVQKLYRLMKKVDAELIEINPLALTKKGLVALDAKVVIDNNALFRQQQFSGLEKRECTPRELEAARYGLHYVELEGNIGVIGDGAGLVMATLDSLKHAGGKAANFLDVGGGVNKKQMMKGIEIVMHKKVNGIFINLFGGVTPGEDVAEAIVLAKKRMQVRIPFVVRLNGVDKEESIQMLREAGIICVESMAEGVRRIVQCR